MKILIISTIFLLLVAVFILFKLFYDAKEELRVVKICYEQNNNEYFDLWNKYLKEMYENIVLKIKLEGGKK